MSDDRKIWISPDFDEPMRLVDEKEYAALREIVEVVAACEARESEGWHQVGLFHDTVNVLWIRAQARALLKLDA